MPPAIRQDSQPEEGQYSYTQYTAPTDIIAVQATVTLRKLRGEFLPQLKSQ